MSPLSRLSAGAGLAFLSTVVPLDLGAQATARDSARHALNRLAWGAAPGQVDQAAREGVMRWIERQLAVESVSDPGLREAERRFSVLRISAEELGAQYVEAQQARRQAQRQRSAGDPPPPPPATRASRPTTPMRDIRALGGQLQQLVVVRAAGSRHQLAEIMADFWANHFNVFYGKSLDRIYLPFYIEETIRPRALGKFEDLLIATAKSPAMLVYLDNVMSVAPGARNPMEDRLRRAARLAPRRRAQMDSMQRQLAERRPTGLNENYARELLELHTLGVDGGYSQQDVVETARILTGWSVERPARGGGFVFNAWAHDRDKKTVLGQEFAAGGGENEGIRLLELLARHPATMHHVSAKLCARFVSDVPPDGCIDDAVRAWRRSGGEIREVLRAVVTSPDFWAPAARNAKVKTPLEFVVSAVRAVGGVPDTTPALAMLVGRLGQPLYLQTAPTGYPETQEDWVNSGALLNRMNFALALASGRAPGVKVDLEGVVPATADRTALVDAVDRVLLAGTMTARTREVILKELEEVGDPVQRRALAIGLVLGGPEFQRQ